MARIAGINIPQNKVVSIALTYIHGIGLYSSKKICKKLNISETTKFAKSIEIPIIASGGISNINNVKALHDLRDIGIYGVIIGKAIYEKKFDLNNLIKLIGN